VILAIQTNLGGPGGIPAYNRMLCRALNDLEISCERCVLVAMDPPGKVRTLSESFPQLVMEGYGGNRMRFVARVLRLAVKGRIDVALVGHVNYAPLGWLLKKLHPKMRYGVMAHGVDVWSRLPWLKRHALQRADFITSVSEYTKAKLIDVNGVCPTRVYNLPNAIGSSGSDQTRLEDQEPERISGSDEQESEQVTNGTVLLSVCRFDASERYKGVDTVIKVLPAVIHRFPDLQYIVVGSGTDLDRHKQLAAERGLTDRVRFLGSISDTKLRACYAACNVFVLPSSSEGFGIVYLEAMRYAKPVIAANSGGAPEVVKDRETGLLVEYGDVNQTAAAIAALCSDAALRKKLGDAGRKRLENNYTFAHFKQRLHEIILAELPPHVINHEQPSVGLADSTF
jgi:phosphatidyl-myo-inositol dimannoside synthase